SGDTEVTLPDASVTVPCGAPGAPDPTPCSVIQPSGARSVPSWVIVGALIVRYPPADSGAAAAPPAGSTVTDAADVMVKSVFKVGYTCRACSVRSLLTFNPARRGA